LGTRKTKRLRLIPCNVSRDRGNDYLDIWPAQPPTTTHFLSFTPPPCQTKSVNSLRSLNNSSAMGTRCVSCSIPLWQLLMHDFPSSLHVAQNLRRRVSHSVLSSFINYLLNTFLNRVHPNLSGSRRWFRCHGFHWILRKTHPYPNVCPQFFTSLDPYSLSISETISLCMSLISSIPMLC